MANKTKYVPIYIPTLCRDRHFITGDKPWHNDYLLIYAGEYYSYLRKYLTVRQRLAWWAGKPKGVKNMFDRHKEWVELEKMNQ